MGYYHARLISSYDSQDNICDSLDQNIASPDLSATHFGKIELRAIYLRLMILILNIFAASLRQLRSNDEIFFKLSTEQVH